MFIPLHDKNPIRRTPIVTYVLVAVNVIVLLWSSGLSDKDHQILVYRYGFVPARIAQLTTGRQITVPMEEIVESRFFGPVEVRRQFPLDPNPREIGISLITCMFLHGGWLHLIGNMWFLYLFGNNVEDHLGRLPYLILYLAGGLIASGTYWLFDQQSLVPVIGASGAVAAILGAYTITWPWARVKTLIFLLFFVTVIEVPALVVNGVWFLAQLLSGQRGATAGGVAWWSHVGGFIAGALLMPLFSALFASKNNQPKWLDESED